MDPGHRVIPSLLSTLPQTRRLVAATAVIALAAAVAAALNWTTMTAAAPPLTASEAVPTAIPDNNTSGISRSVLVSGASDYVAEHVQVTVTVSHTYAGDLRFELVSPEGTVSVLAETRGAENAEWTSNTWTFMTVANWGENPNGTWTLRVSNDGPSVASNVVVTDPLPLDIDAVALSTTQGSCTFDTTTNTVTCNLGSLAVGATST